jgi:hypothetical protein
MEKEGKEKFKDFTDGSSDNKKEYKNKIIWLHVSKKKKHLYAFVNEGEFCNAKSILMNKSEVEDLLSGKVQGTKITIMEVKDDLDGTKAKGR